MPYTHNLEISIDGASLEIGKMDDLSLQLSYGLEDPENFDQKQGSVAMDIDVPATPNNSKIFNAFEQPNIEDMSGDDYYKNPRPCQIIVDGITVMKGKSILESATHTRLPEKYTFNCYGNTGDWVIDARNLTLWDCLSTTTHEFTVENVEASWTEFNTDEAHDYVYAPVRYRQPFGTNDDSVNIYALRPSLSRYWLIIRGFRALGYKVNSEFLNSNYYQGMTLPWVWGDFYDINSQLTDGIAFKAAGDISDMMSNEPPPETGDASIIVWTGSASGTVAPSAHGTSWWGNPTSGLTSGGGTINPTGGQYVFTGNIHTDNKFRMTDTTPPNGYDNFSLYSFDDTTGTMIWQYNPPAALSTFIGSNITANFVLNLLLVITSFHGDNVMVALEVTHVFEDGSPDVVTNNSILPTGGAIVGATTYPDSTGFPTTPTVYNFSVPNINTGDTLKFRLRALSDGGGAAPNIMVAQSGCINVNPSVTGASNWQYNPTTEQWGHVYTDLTDNIWQQTFSTLEMTGLELQIGGTVNFQFYDKFRSYNWLDMLRGEIDAYNLSIQTDPINQVVTIEPTHNYVLPDGTQMQGYFKTDRLDWTTKQDVSKENVMQLFSDSTRQLDFQFQQDGSDGGQNIWAARYKSVYLNNVRSTNFNNLNDSNNDNGIIAAVPGASRYLLPPRFQKGTTQKTNRFYSATMHYKHSKWANIGQLNSTGTPPPLLAPQLICIIPENVSDTSADAITQTFTPKMAFYAGQQSILGVGGWRWQGDPAGRGTDIDGNGIPTYNSASDVIIQSNGEAQPLSSISSIGFQLPYMFAVDYTGVAGSSPGSIAPVLTYCDQNINGTIVPGLMKTFFLKRMATMRNGKLYKAYMRLTLSDVTDWEHRNDIVINGARYNLIAIDGYKPLSDSSCQCTLWKATAPEQVDLDNSFPSSESILDNPSTLAQFDLKYAPLLLFMTDIPEIN